MAVATDRFEGLAVEAAAQSGLPDARIVTLEHPIGGTARETLENRADGLVEEVLARFTHSGPTGGG